MKSRIVLGALLLAPVAVAQGDKDYRLDIRWNRMYGYDEMVGLMRRIQTAWPDLVSMRSIGKSAQGRDLWMLVVNNPATGSDREKPAFYSDGNIHGNEVQGSEANLYLVWYLMEHYGKLDRLTGLVDRCAFYILPSVNPDARASWFAEPHTASSHRSGAIPVDSDRDGKFDEDGPDDLNGDGEITMMRKRVPLGEGDYRELRDHPGLMERVRGDQQGDWILLGQEGIDNDGDGRINEDGIGYYDMNRNWPSGWNPEYIQGGAGDYPLDKPETAAIATFVLDHPNIAGVQAFHNAGGMILRGPGVEAYGEYPRTDVRVYDQLGQDGEFMLPFYRYMVIWKDLYSVSGGFVNWTYEGLGIFSFTNEMWSSARRMQSRDRRLDQVERRKWEDLLTFGEDYVPWQEYEHPFYGTIEIGGARKMTGRVPPAWLMEEELHRNAAFVIHHADSMPEVDVGEPVVRPAPGGLHYVDVTVHNRRLIPTRSALAAAQHIGLPDRLEFDGGEPLTVVAGGTPTDRFRLERIALQDKNPRVLLAERGVPGKGEWKVRWIVAGRGPFVVRYRAEKARDREVAGEIR